MTISKNIKLMLPYSIFLFQALHRADVSTQIIIQNIRRFGWWCTM